MTTPVEERLREALATRADAITAADLRPEPPPSALGAGRAHRRPWLLHKLVPARRMPSRSRGTGQDGGPVSRRGPASSRRARWVPILAGVAAVVVVFAVLFAWRPQQPTPPGRAPYLPGDAPTPSVVPPPPYRPTPQPETSTSVTGSSPLPPASRPPHSTSIAPPPSSAPTPTPARPPASPPGVTAPPKTATTTIPASPGVFPPETSPR